MKGERAIWALVWALFVLLAVVVIVGLVQQSLDTTGVALALCTALFGTGGGFLLRFKTQAPPPPPAEPPTEDQKP